MSEKDLPLTVSGPPDDPRFIPLLSSTMFVVDADSFARQMLWKEFHTEHDWESESLGMIRVVGEFAGVPTWVEFFWVTIDGQRVMFYTPISEVVHHGLVEKWLRLHCNPTWDGGTRRAHCDAMNFHHCLDAIEEANKVAAGTATP